jgi:hypothetical protein
MLGYTLLLTGLTVMARLPRLTRKPGWWALGIAIFIVAAVVCSFTLEVERWWHIGVALIVALIACGMNILRRKIGLPGTKSLLALGCIATAVVVWDYVYPLDHLGPLWPLFLAGALFAYLWWIGILIFDLTFIWHRYIRMSMCLPALQAAQRGHAVAKRKARDAVLGAT